MGPGDVRMARDLGVDGHGREERDEEEETRREGRERPGGEEHDAGLVAERREWSTPVSQRTRYPGYVFSRHAFGKTRPIGRTKRIRPNSFDVKRIFAYNGARSGHRRKGGFDVMPTSRFRPLTGLHRDRGALPAPHVAFLLALLAAAAGLVAALAG